MAVPNQTEPEAAWWPRAGQPGGPVEYAGPAMSPPGAVPGYPGGEPGWQGTPPYPPTGPNSVAAPTATWNNAYWNGTAWVGAPDNAQTGQTTAAAGPPRVMGEPAPSVPPWAMPPLPPGEAMSPGYPVQRSSAPPLPPGEGTYEYQPGPGEAGGGAPTSGYSHNGPMTVPPRGVRWQALPPGRRGSRSQLEADRYRNYLAAERRSAALYRDLAAASGGEQGQVLNKLAEVEDEHAEHWAGQLRGLGEPVPAVQRRRTMRNRVLTGMARQFSLSSVLPALERAERTGAGVYDDESAARPGMSVDEREHARMLAGMSIRRVGKGGIGAGESWHRSDRSGALRAAVFGVNDGLVSNAALVLGFVGSGAPTGAILLAGIAGLLAGAFSMAAGEFISVSSQRDMFEAEIRLEEQELLTFPEGEQRELALLYQVKGLSKEQAEETARTIMQDRKVALDTLAREELGLDPDELGSPWATAGSSALSFAAGAFVVVLPFLVASGTGAAVASVVAAAVALGAVGGGLGWLSGNSVLKGALRQVIVGGLAAGTAFGIGGILGVKAS